MSSHLRFVQARAQGPAFSVRLAHHHPHGVDLEKEQVDAVKGNKSNKQFRVVAVVSAHNRDPQETVLPGEPHAVHVGLWGCRSASVG
jgi:hypothetical protein